MEQWVNLKMHLTLKNCNPYGTYDLETMVYLTKNFYFKTVQNSKVVPVPHKW